MCDCVGWKIGLLLYSHPTSIFINRRRFSHSLIKLNMRFKYEIKSLDIFRAMEDLHESEEFELSHKLDNTLCYIYLYDVIYE